MRAIGFTPVDEVVDQVRELHVWVEHYNEVYCEGCNFGGWEGEAPEWPCQTARLVYTDEEIAVVTEAVKLAAKWSMQRWLCTASHRMREPRNWWEGWADISIADKVFPKIPVGRVGPVTYTFKKD